MAIAMHSIAHMSAHYLFMAAIGILDYRPSSRRIAFKDNRSSIKSLSMVRGLSIIVTAIDDRPEASEHAAGHSKLHAGIHCIKTHVSTNSCTKSSPCTIEILIRAHGTSGDTCAPANRHGIKDDCSDHSGRSVVS